MTRRWKRPGATSGGVGDLDHADLSTTQIYTQVDIRELKEIHAVTHPAEMANTTLVARPEETLGKA